MTDAQLLPLLELFLGLEIEVLEGLRVKEHLVIALVLNLLAESVLLQDRGVRLPPLFMLKKLIVFPPSVLCRARAFQGLADLFLIDYDDIFLVGMVLVSLLLERGLGDIHDKGTLLGKHHVLLRELWSQTSPQL